MYLSEKTEELLNKLFDVIKYSLMVGGLETYTIVWKNGNKKMNFTTDCSGLDTNVCFDDRIYLEKESKSKEEFLRFFDVEGFSSADVWLEFNGERQLHLQKIENGSVEEVYQTYVYSHRNQEETQVEEEEPEIITEELEEKDDTFHLSEEQIEKLQKEIETYEETVEEKEEILTDQGLIGCVKCGGTGVIVGKTGITLRCSCSMPKTVEEGQREAKEMAYLSEHDELRVTDLDKVLIPKHRQKDAFNTDFIKNKISEMFISESNSTGIKTQISNWAFYERMMAELLLQVNNMTLNNSYIIGAPNGFGKETFANTVIRILDKQNRKAVPYINLSTLGTLYESHRKSKENYLKYGGKQQEVMKKDGYQWQDYIEADIAIVSLTGVLAKEYESQVLSLLVKQRSFENKPTIVMLEHTLDVYTMDSKLYKNYWSDMLVHSRRPVSSSKEDVLEKELTRIRNLASGCGVDRFIYFSTYKVSNL